MSLERLGLSGDGRSKRRVGQARALSRTTNALKRDAFVAPDAALADPAGMAEMNERLCDHGSRAYLANHVRR